MYNTSLANELARTAKKVVQIPYSVNNKLEFKHFDIVVFQSYSKRDELFLYLEMFFSTIKSNHHVATKEAWIFIDPHKSKEHLFLALELGLLQKAAPCIIRRIFVEPSCNLNQEEINQRIIDRAKQGFINISVGQRFDIELSFYLLEVVFFRYLRLINLT